MVYYSESDWCAKVHYTNSVLDDGSLLWEQEQEGDLRLPTMRVLSG